MQDQSYQSFIMNWKINRIFSNDQILSIVQDLSWRCSEIIITTYFPLEKLKLGLEIFEFD